MASLALAASMLGLAYAAVPLYRMFCEATGFAGTTQRATKASDTVLEKTITIRFDANVGGDLGWSFEPERRTVEIKIGENTLAYYRATNTSNRLLAGTATFNVTPEVAGGYFNKIQCFCFTEQRLEPGQSADLPVSFFIDPAILNDKDTRELSEITLSYTFYPVENSKPSATAKEAARAPGKGS